MAAPESPFDVLARRAPAGTVRLGTERVSALLDRVGNPERALRVVHVGGTNGKGSVVAMVDAALREAGHRVGRFTSPPLVRASDAIRVDGSPIPESFVRSFLDDVLPWADRLDDPPTGFEVTTALALAWFARERVDAAVVEVGLGGLRDATNVFERPLATVVTNVDADHLELIGPTLLDAAREKAGIARRGAPFVTGAMGEARDALLAEAAARGASPIRALGRDFEAHPIEGDLAGERFGVTGLARAYPDEMRVALPGAHQASNAALALAALEACDAAGLAAPVDACARGLEKVEWPGRLQHLPGRPSLLLDGAHNPAGVESLVAFLKEQELRPVLLFGCLSDKAWMDMVVPLSEVGVAAVVTLPPNARALDPPETAREFSRQGLVSTVVRDPRRALATAIGQAGEDGTVLVCGSLFLVGEVLRILETAAREAEAGSP